MMYYILKVEVGLKSYLSRGRLKVLLTPDKPTYSENRIVNAQNNQWAYHHNV